MTDTIRLRYVGDNAYLPGVPACDIDVNVDEADALIATGLYEPEPVPEVVAETDEEGEDLDGRTLLRR